MGIYADVYALLQLNTALTDLVDVRLYPDRGKEDTALPFAVYQCDVIDADMPVVSGSTQPVLTPYQVQLVIVSLTKAEALTVHESIRTQFHGKVFPSQSVKGCFVAPHVSEQVESWYQGTTTLKVWHDD